MDESRMDSNTWLHTATKGIRFGPDREAVSRELLEHIEDKTVDLMRIFPDMSWDEARQRALDDMGDPAEIGRDLARVHRPWLGWLWRASQWVLGLVFLPLLFILLQGAVNGGILGGWYGGLHYGLYYHNTNLEAQIQDTADIRPIIPSDARLVIEGCLLTMPEAAVMDWAGETRVGAILRTVSPRFWERDSRNLCHRVRAVDSLGNRYSSYEERWDAWNDGTKEWGFVNGHIDAYGPLHTEYAIWVHGVEPAAEWVRLEYDWLGRSFSMTIDMTEVGT